jgi:hypothetical protein
VQAYIAAMPGWKHDVGHRLDALIARTLPDVRKAVRWNTPFYGIDGQGWFLGFHCLTKYVKVTFFRGTSLRPVPPCESKQKDVRYLDIHEVYISLNSAIVAPRRALASADVAREFLATLQAKHVRTHMRMYSPAPSPIVNTNLSGPPLQPSSASTYEKRGFVRLDHNQTAITRY